jgi:membrane protein DedA with SNARE-associated domain
MRAMPIDLAHLIATHGYWVTFVGSALEGETVLVLAGLAAHRGYLALPALVTLAAAGGFFGDQVYFLIGRSWGAAFLARFPRLEPKAAQAAALILRHPELAVIGVRFTYGMRIVGPIAIGMSGIGWLHYALLNAAGATIWSTCWIGAGYLVGTAIEAALGDLKRIEHVVLIVAAIAAIVAPLALRWWRHAGSRRGGPSR